MDITAQIKNYDYKDFVPKRKASHSLPTYLQGR